jgi:hypothetical protein
MGKSLSALCLGRSLTREPTSVGPSKRATLAWLVEVSMPKTRTPER